MNYTTLYTIDEQLPVSSERMFPASPFPRKYVHSAIGSLRHAVQAVQALRAAGYDPRDIHVMASWDFVDAVEHKRQRRLSTLLSRIASFFDEGFGDVYLHEARRGYHILVVRLSRASQMHQVRDLLLPYHVHLVKYVDAWTVADLTCSQDDAIYIV
jgi:hypothetical protein